MTQEAAELDESAFRAIFDAAPGSYLILRPDPRFTIVAVNDSYLRATMTTREKLIGRGMFEAFPDNPNDPTATGVQNLRDSFQHVLAHRKPHTMAVQKYDIKRPEGGFEARHWSPTTSPVLGADGGVLFIIHHVEDVTESMQLETREKERKNEADELRGRADRMESEAFQRTQELATANADLRRQVEERTQAETALAGEQDFLRAVLDHAADGIVACDGNGVLRFFNRATRMFHGLPEQPLAPEQWAGHYDLFQSDGTTPMTKEQVPLFRALTEGAVKDAEMVIAPKGHPPRLLTANGRTITDTTGRKLGAVVVMHDLTTRKLAEEQRERAVREEAARRAVEASAGRLAESEERLRLILESVRDYAIFTTDLSGLVTEWNVGAERLFGYAASEIVGQNAAILFTDEDQAQGIPEAERAQARDGGYAEDVRWHQRKDKSRFFASGVTSLLRDGGGGLRGFVKICRDVTAERQADLQLEEARAQIAAAVEAERNQLIEMLNQAPSFMVVLLGPQHVISRANQRYLDLIGHRDVLGKPVREALPEVEGQGYFEMLDRVYATGVPEGGAGVRVMLQRQADEPPEERIVEFVYQAFRETDGTIAGVFVHGIDLTAHKRAEAAVRASEARYRSLFSSIDQGFCVIEVIFDESGRPVDYRFLEANPAFEQQTGLIDAIGKTSRELVPTLESRWYEMYGRVALTGEPVRFEDHAEPMGRWFDVYAFRLGEAKDRRVAILFKDVTEARRVSQELDRLAESRRMALDAADLGWWHLDSASGDVIYDERLGKFFGLPSGGGRLDYDGIIRLIHPADQSRVEAAVKAALDPNDPREYAIEYRTVHVDGSERWVFASGQAYFAGEGSERRYSSFVGTIADITDRKLAEAERQALLEAEQSARAEAERASRMKDEFLATLSHELRTPLNAILGWSQILSSGTRDEADLREGLKTIERNARAQTQIIEDLLDMSRIISGKVRLDVQQVDLAAVVREAAATSKPSADAKGIRLQTVLDPHAGPVSGDPARLQQVMWNLLTNAVKFTPKGGRVQVLLQSVNSHIEVSVSDTGEGIKPEFLAHVFDRFRQADATTTRRHGGLGLGLSIVKQLVELHGGSIEVKSAGVGQGTTFTLSLPLTVIQPEPDSDVERHHPRTSQPAGVLLDGCVQIAGLKILVVDDEADARALVKRLLEDCDAQVIVAGTAAEAIERVRTEKPDVLVCDIGMPGEDGYSLIRRVRALGSEQGGQVPAAALTAYARAEDRVKAILAGFQMHLAKPVEPAELIATVAGLAGRTGANNGSR
ncbi:MAG TPA: PAS domain S-box protein [Tepidisphaeraceae bacterium]|jgi:PAS domain S-box-containing protein